MPVEAAYGGSQEERESLLLPRLDLARGPSASFHDSDAVVESDDDQQHVPGQSRTTNADRRHRSRRLVFTTSALVILPFVGLIVLSVGVPSAAPPWLHILLLAPSSLSALTFESCSPITTVAAASRTFFPIFPVARGRSLVLVVHSAHDVAYPENLAYFVRKGVRCWQDADYVFIIQRNDAASFHQPGNLTWQSGLPLLPPNARYVLHQNECMDIGSVGWLLSLPPSHPDFVDTARYRWFFFMNTSVRGPMLPAFLEDHMDPDHSVQCPADASHALLEQLRHTAGLFSWFHVFLAKVDQRVKMVGCTISCAFATHIQSYLLAMDYIALQVVWQDHGLEAHDIPDPDLRQRFLSHQMQKPGFNESLTRPKKPRKPLRLEEDFCRWQKHGGLAGLHKNHSLVLACHRDFWDTVFNGEIGISQAVIKAGYGIASLELYWRGVDFRLAPDVCAAMASVQAPWSHYDDGVPVERTRPFDGRLFFNEPQSVVFTKFKNNTQYETDDRVKALLAWEDLHNRTMRWQRTHHATLHNITHVSAYGH